MTTRACAAIGFVALLSVASGCSSSSSGSAPSNPDSGASDAHHVTPDASTADAPTPKDTGTHDALTPVPDATSTLVDASDAGAGDAGMDVTDTPFDGAGFVALDGGSAPITGVTAETWTWIPFPESSCRDGSATGLGVNFNPASQNVLLYLEGGGACFNFETCAGNPSSFGASDFPTRFPTNGDGGTPELGNGILDRSASNPVGDWNFIYVPYCTGDIHAGNATGVTIADVPGTQSFVGYQNVNLFLQRIVPTFPSAAQVLLTGISGGGFGAAANYEHVQRAFGSVPVNLIDDSGPFMEDPYLATCLQNEVRGLWGLDATIGHDCAGACDDEAAFFTDFARHIASTHPARQIGLLDSYGDNTITAFFGFGSADCTQFVQETPTTFTAGLNDIRTALSAETNLSTFYFAGTDHTSLGDDNYYSRTTTTADGGTIPLTTWVADVVAGKTVNAGQ